MAFTPRSRSCRSIRRPSLSTDAVLLIGDRAMHACLPGFRHSYDLGQEWTDWTGFPFVYAVRGGSGKGIELGDAGAGVPSAKEYGVEHAGEIAQPARAAAPRPSNT